MSRRRSAQKREVLPDPRFGNILISKFINALMYDGKRSIAESIMYGAMEIVAEKAKQEPADIFEEAINKVRPELEVRARRIGGATYQVPMDVRPERSQTLAFRWVIKAARGRSEKTMRERLGAELLEASQGRGSSVKRREDTLKVAEANRAFAHYRW